jgi:hypothetical protein
MLNRCGGEESDKPCAAPYYRQNRNGAGSVNDLIWPYEASPQADNRLHSASLTFAAAKVRLVNLVKPREGAEAGSRHVVLGGKRGNRANPS